MTVEEARLEYMALAELWRNHRCLSVPCAFAGAFGLLFEATSIELDLAVAEQCNERTLELIP